MNDQPHRPARSPTLKVWLVVLSCVSVLAIPLSLFWAMMSAMATTTTDNAAFANAYVLINLAIPALILLGVVGGWIAWSVRRTRLGWTFVFLPLAPFVISVAMMAAWPAS